MSRTVYASHFSNNTIKELSQVEILWVTEDQMEKLGINMVKVQPLKHKL